LPFHLWKCAGYIQERRIHTAANTYKATRPKERKGQKAKTLSKAISPNRKWALRSWFGFDTDQAKLLLKKSFPFHKIVCPIVKDDIIPVFQIAQQAVIIIFLKMQWPKLLLASITISSGSNACGVNSSSPD